MKYILSLSFILPCISCTSPNIVLPSQTGRWVFTEQQRIIHTNNLVIKDTTFNTITGILMFNDLGTLFWIVDNDTIEYQWAYNKTSQNIILTDDIFSTKIYHVVSAKASGEKWEYEKIFDLGNDETNLITESLELSRQK